MPALFKKESLFLFCWIGIAVLALILDYFTGPFIRFPITYLAPIGLASWINGLRWGLALAVAMPLIHFSFINFWISPFPLADAAVNTIVRIVVFSSFAYLVNKVTLQKRELEKEIMTLKGILPICMFCKKIRNHDGIWETLEVYISKRSNAEFSHGMCPECAKKNYPDIFKP